MTTLSPHDVWPASFPAGYVLFPACQWGESDGLWPQGGGGGYIRHYIPNMFGVYSIGMPFKHQVTVVVFRAWFCTDGQVGSNAMLGGLTHVGSMHVALA